MFMKANHLLPIAAFCLMTASCNTGKQQADLQQASSSPILTQRLYPELTFTNTHVAVG